MLVESIVILEFLNETFPTAHLLPSDPILRANARIFISILDHKLFEGYRDFFFIGSSPATGLLAAFETLQQRLPPIEKGRFAVGEWSIADIAAGPLLVRIVMMLEHDLGKYNKGEGPKTLEVLRGPKYQRIMQYLEDVKEWPSFKTTWDEVSVASTGYFGTGALGSGADGIVEADCARHLEEQPVLQA